MAAVGGEPGVSDPGPVDGEPPGPAGGFALGDERGDPEVVFGGETQQVVVQVREAEVRDVVTHPPMLSAPRGGWQLVQVIHATPQSETERFRFAKGRGIV
ncbi:hypothetical protein GCM10020254_50240 [Streptomyces goshikiensis]